MKITTRNGLFHLIQCYFRKVFPMLREMDKIFVSLDWKSPRQLNFISGVKDFHKCSELCEVIFDSFLKEVICKFQKREIGSEFVG